MKEKYVGDINDYRKYALLRRLQSVSGLRLGVCWMLTPSDGSRDGRKLAYLRQPKEERHDPELYRLLQRLANDPDTRRLEHIETSGTLSGAIYFNDLVPDLLTERRMWFAGALRSLCETQLIFFDPDNGLDVPSKGKGTKGSSKYLYRDEVAEAFRRGHSLLIYQHFAREDHEGFITRICSSLEWHCVDASIWTFRTSNVVFLLLIRPDHDAEIRAAAQSVSRFDPKFIRVEIHRSP